MTPQHLNRTSPTKLLRQYFPKTIDSMLAHGGLDEDYVADDLRLSFVMFLVLKTAVAAPSSYASDPYLYE